MSGDKLSRYERGEGGRGKSYIQVVKEHIPKVRANGVVVRCPGLFDGEAIIQVDEKNRFFLFSIMATKPTLDTFLDTFHELCQESYRQCILQRKE